MNATISLRDYLLKEKDFFIPNYQRGYVWGKMKKGDAKDSVTYMLESLLEGYQIKSEIFIQGVTVSETDSEITLIDGQQRTTFFYLLLKKLGYKGKIVIRYGIREESNAFLSKENLVAECDDNPKEEFQDIYFFKKTLRIISERTKDFCEQYKQEFCDYILDYVKFLYIDIPENKATKVFSMMNGNKAEMKAEELIKAELLRLASLNNQNFESKSEKEKSSIEWDNNLLRSRYAREWDKWLQWWNRNDVKCFFRVDNVIMGLLIIIFQKKMGKELSFTHFKSDFLSGQKPIEAKRAFEGLRRLQKRFEDAFNSPVVYNKIGAIIRVGDKDSFTQWYFGGGNISMVDLDQYYRLAFLRLTHKEILEELLLKQQKQESEAFKNKYAERLNELGSDNLYNDYAEEAFRLLLRLNIDEDNKQEDGKGRRFDFSIWDRNDSRGRSLEHIYPKSKVLHKEKGNNGLREIVNGKGDKLQSLPSDKENHIARCTCRCFIDNKRISASEHSIGNLVLLYKDDNSSFNDSSFSDKKGLFFKVPNSKHVNEIFKSRHLLHTIYKFANSKWAGVEIAQNKYQTLKDFKEYYGK